MKITRLIRSEAHSHLRLAKIHPKSGGCAERRTDATFMCLSKGKHGFRLPHFVACDVLNLMGDPDMESWSR